MLSGSLLSASSRSTKRLLCIASAGRSALVSHQIRSASKRSSISSLKLGKALLSGPTQNRSYASSVFVKPTRRPEFKKVHSFY